MTTEGTTTKREAPVVVDLTDLTFDELDEAARLMESHKPPIGRLTAYAYVGLRKARPGLTIDDARKLGPRDVKLIETDPEVDDEGPTSAP